ncbi:leucine-rich repeat domain-containing protein [Laspinema palackyanum]|uniref:leucine-rich repeat domain-containing protein n=1 Tax=Laspinema palackyanum TaxID=3231601 RepID=UPI00345C6394|nr:leucine-rich repeat domain-containing protein [Laspinema sp. D2c]
MTEEELLQIIQQAAEDKVTSLDLSNTQLSALPQEIGELSNLTELNLSYNYLRDLPQEIGQLSNLINLDLWSNQLSALHPEIGQLSNLTELGLAGNKLTALPQEIGQLSNLTELDLAGNKLTALPPEIGQLSNLTVLYLWRNQLSVLPPEIGQLSNLTVLDLADNQLTALPPEIGQLFNLTELDLADNQLSVLPPEIGQLSNLTELDLSSNPLISLPPEILNQGIGATLAYLREQLQSPQPQVQWISKLMVVGDGGVGKTSLLKVLRGESFNPQEFTTHGIDIRTLEFPHPREPDVTMQLNAWDFGEQEISHATHQFFLTNRSLFLLVWNAGDGYEQGKIYNWLDTLSSLAPESSILLVATHIDEQNSDLPFAQLQGQYPKIEGHYEIDSQTGQGLDNLYQSIVNTAAQLPLMGKRWPKTCLNAAHDIRSLSEQYITPQQLARRMTRRGVDPNQVASLAQYLHDIGKIVYFQDNPALSEIVILKPKWIAEQIGKVFSSEPVKQRQGILTRGEMNQLWEDIDSFIRPYFLRLLEHFDLAYPLRNEAEFLPEEVSLILEFVPLNPPPYQHQWDAILETENCHRLERKWQLDRLPAGLPTRLIADSHRFSTGIHWRNGALLADSKPEKHLGLFEAFPEKNALQLAVRGPMPIHFFTLLRDRLDIMLSRFSDLEAKCTIPCPGGPDKTCSHEFEEEYVKQCYATHQLTLECPECQENLSAIALLFGVEIPPPSNPPTVSSPTLSIPTFSGLSRFEELERQIDRGKTYIQSALTEVAQLHQEDLRKVAQLYQGEFIKIVRLKQQSIEAESPCVFVVHSPERGNWQNRIFGQQSELQLCCEAPGKWHPVDGAVYSLSGDNEWFHIMAPYIQQLAASWKYTVESQNNIAMEMQTLAEEFPPLNGWEATELLKSLGIGTEENFNPEQLQLAALRVLRQLLDEKDPHHHWGGLRKVLTPEGHYLWLCEHHAREYRR